MDEIELSPQEEAALSRARSKLDKERQSAALIGGVEKRLIEIVGYDSNWPDLFALQERIVRNAVGAAALCSRVRQRLKFTFFKGFKVDSWHS